MAISSVRWFNSDMMDAPVLSGVYGSLNTVLKKCLIDGFNEQSITSIEVDGAGIATATFAEAHGFLKHSWIRISGANEEELNDDFQIIFVSTTILRFVVTGTGAFTATGTLLARFAPPGNYWEIAAEDVGTHKLAIRSNHPEATGNSLYLEDNKDIGNSSRPKTTASVWGVEEVVDINTLNLTWGNWHWTKSNTWGQNTGARWWSIFTDERLIYLFVQGMSDSYSSVYIDCFVFGDINSYQINDNHHCILVMGSDELENTSSSSAFDLISSHMRSQFALLTSNTHKRINRNWDQFQSNQSISMFGSVTNYLSRGGLSLPNPSGNIVFFNEIHIRDNDSIRGELPGGFQSVHAPQFRNFEVFEVNSKKYMIIACSTGWNGDFTSSNSNSSGQIFIDITGPWR